MFYPETFLYGDLTEEELTNDTAAIYVPVPNQRSGEANAPADFAYGSYRLQIRLDQFVVNDVFQFCCSNITWIRWIIRVLCWKCMNDTNFS